MSFRVTETRPPAPPDCLLLSSCTNKAFLLENTASRVPFPPTKCKGAAPDLEGEGRPPVLSGPVSLSLGWRGAQGRASPGGLERGRGAPETRALCPAATVAFGPRGGGVPVFSDFPTDRFLRLRSRPCPCEGASMLLRASGPGVADCPCVTHTHTRARAEALPSTGPAAVPYGLPNTCLLQGPHGCWPLPPP